MRAIEWSELSHRDALEPAWYDEFLREVSMSVGVYHLKAGASDPQRPHREDELYVVMEGKACIQVGDDHRDVAAGSIVFVQKTVPHRFHSIERDLKVLVIFSPAETSSA